jgi:hypothetical protein
MTLVAWPPPLWQEILLLALVVLLFLAYWFRRNVLAELKAQPPGELIEQICRANDLGFPTILERLQAGHDLQSWAMAGRVLGRDYKLLTFLLFHAGGTGRSRVTFSDRMLMADFRLMQIRYWITLSIAQRPPRQALEEMVRILGRLADSVARRVYPARSRSTTA